MQIELIIVFPQAPGDGEGQGNLECYNPWCFKESDMTEQQNNNNYPRIQKRQLLFTEESEGERVCLTM